MPAIPMIDTAARAAAVGILRELSAGQLLPSVWEDTWPKKTKDLAVRSVGYWVWTQFDDHIDAPIRIEENSEQQTILRNAIRFLSSGSEFHAKDSGIAHKVKTIFVGGVEWVGCELPWHVNWPFPPTLKSD